MEFSYLSQIFQNLEKTSKRLEKILILRDFILSNKSNSPLILDMIVGNFQRNIDKKSLGISLKTLFSSISFASGNSEEEVEKYFNRIGDIGETSIYFLKNKKKHNYLSEKKLLIEDIIDAFNKISQKIGNNKNMAKKEIISKLFLYAKEELEYKFLARLFLDDLRIGVSEGVIKEAIVQTYFPHIIGITNICENCKYENLNMSFCLKCKNPLSSKIDEKIFETKYRICEIGTPKNYLGIDEFIGGRNYDELIKFSLRLNPQTDIIKTKESRELYNFFLQSFENKYNLINSFSDSIKEISIDLQNVLKTQIILNKPIKSMLGTRINTINEAFEICEKPCFSDFKYDGLRIQIHNNFGKITFFSRNLDDITKQFPELVKIIQDNFSDISFVLDTECVGFDFEKKEFLPFQILSRRIMSKKFDDVSQIKVVLKAFDIIYLNGETLLNKKFEERRNLLESIFIQRKLIFLKNINLII